MNRVIHRKVSSHLQAGGVGAALPDVAFPTLALVPIALGGFVVIAGKIVTGVALMGVGVAYAAYKLYAVEPGEPASEKPTTPSASKPAAKKSSTTTVVKEGGGARKPSQGGASYGEGGSTVDAGSNPFGTGPLSDESHDDTVGDSL